jgi:hypothetical protein
MHLFERPCPAGWVYPCSLEDISERLSRLPEQDLAGLWSVGLVPSTRKDCGANGRYCYTGERPEINLFSYPDSLRFKLMAHTRLGEIHRCLAVERQYGMGIEAIGTRYVCVWSPEDLRRFMVEHVLLHEVGHHIYHRDRRLQEYRYNPRTTESEQFAEAYAVRHSRQYKT